MSEHEELLQEIRALRNELRDHVITFCGHPTMNLRFLPGDTLVIKFNGLLDQELATTLEERTKRYVPDGVKIMIIDKNIDIMKLERP